MPRGLEKCPGSEEDDSYFFRVPNQSDRSNNAAPEIAWSTLPGLQTGSPPWGPNVQTLAGRLPLIGLNQPPQRERRSTRTNTLTCG
jgi:hypothetical protein